MAQTRDNLGDLYNAIKDDYDIGTEQEFRKKMLAPGKLGYNKRKALYDALKADGAVQSPTYEDFRDRLGLVARSSVPAAKPAPAKPAAATTPAPAKPATTTPAKPAASKPAPAQRPAASAPAKQPAAAPTASPQRSAPAKPVQASQSNRPRVRVTRVVLPTGPNPFTGMLADAREQNAASAQQMQQDMARSRSRFGLGTEPRGGLRFGNERGQTLIERGMQQQAEERERQQRRQSADEAATPKAGQAAPVYDFADPLALQMGTQAQADKQTGFVAGQTARRQREEQRRSRLLAPQAPGASLTVGMKEDEVQAYIDKVQQEASNAAKNAYKKNTGGAPATVGPKFSIGQNLVEAQMQGRQLETQADRAERDTYDYLKDHIDDAHKRDVMEMYGMDDEKQWDNYLRAMARGETTSAMMDDARQSANFMTNMMESSLIGKGVMAGSMPLRQRQMLSQANQEWAQEASAWKSVPSAVAGMVLDTGPFMGFGLGAGLATRGMQGAAAQGVRLFNALTKAAPKAAPRIWASVADAAANRLGAQAAAKSWFGLMGRGGLTLGFYQATDDALRQAFGGDMEQAAMGNYGEDKSVDLGEVGKEFVKGTVAGAATAGVGRLTGRASRYLSGGKKAAAEVGSFAAEAGTFAAANIGFQALEGDLTLDSAKDELIGSTQFLLGLKAQRAIPRTIGALWNNRKNPAGVFTGAWRDLHQKAEMRLQDNDANLNADEITALREAGFTTGKTTKDVLRDLFSFKQEDLHKKGLQEQTDKVAESNYLALLADKRVPASAKTKIAWLVEGKARRYQNPPSEGEVIVNDDGSAQVRIYCKDTDGESALYSVKSFKNKAEADKWLADAQDELQANRMNVEALGYMGAWVGVSRAEVMNGLSEQERTIYQQARQKQTRGVELDAQEQAIVDRVNELTKAGIDGVGGMDGVVRRFEQQEGLEEGTVKKIAQKYNQRQNLTADETDIARRFADWLEPTTTQRAQEFNLLSQEGFEQAGEDIPTPTDPDDPQTAAWQRGYEAYEQERRDIAIEQADPDNAEAQEAWNGVVQHIREDAEFQAASSREFVQQITHEDGSIHPAILKEKDEDGYAKYAYILSGHVQMTPDGTTVDPSSDESVIIYDLTTGKKSMIAPRADTGISVVIDPYPVAKEEARIESEKEQYIQERIDDARGTVRVNPGETITLPTGEQAQVLAIDGDGENITVSLGDGTQTSVQRSELQRAADEAAIADYRQRHGITDEPAAEEQPAEEPQSNTANQSNQVIEGAPSEYTEGMEITVRDDDGKEKPAIVMRRGHYENARDFVPDGEGKIIEYLVAREEEPRREHEDRLAGKVVSHVPVRPQQPEEAGELGESQEPTTEPTTETAAPATEPVAEPTAPAEPAEPQQAGELDQLGELGESDQLDQPAQSNQSDQPAPAEEPASDAMPMREDGEEDWQAATPARAHTYIYNGESGLSRSEANDFVAAQMSAATNALAKAKGAKMPKMGTSIKQYNDAKAKRQEKIDEAKRRLKYWQQVRDIQNGIQQREAAEQAARDAERHDEAVAQAQADYEARKQAEAERKAVGNENPMPAITEKWNTATKIDGSRDEMVLPDGTSLRGHYVLHESGASSPSHDPTTWHQTEGFPMDANDNSVNDRDYEHDRDAQEHTQSIARQYDQRALQSVPVVSRDGVVLSGNGRTMAGELAARDNTDGAYVDYLKEHAPKYGFTREQVEGMQHPRVSFVPDEQMPYTAETFAKFNQQEMKSQNKTEQAVKLGKTVGDDTFRDIVRTINGYDTLGDFYNDAQASLGAVYELQRSGVIPQTQLAEMVDGVRGQEKLSAVGREFLENMLIGKAFDSDPDVVRMLTAEPSMRQSVITALGEIADNVALGEGWSLQSELGDAVRLCFDARKGGAKYGEIVSVYARQGVLFADPDQLQTMADFNNATMLMLADVLNDKRVTLLKTTLQLYNSEARVSASGQTDMFAGGVRSREDILRSVIKYINDNYGKRKEIDAARRTAVERRKAESVSEDGAPAESSTEGEGRNTPASSKGVSQASEAGVRQSEQAGGQNEQTGSIERQVSDEAFDDIMRQLGDIFGEEINMVDFFSDEWDKTPKVDLGIEEGEEIGVDKIRDLFEQLNDNAVIGALAERVFNVAEHLNLKIRFENSREFKFGMQGAYLPAGNAIRYRIDYFTHGGISAQDKAHVLLHELVHSVTIYAMFDYERGGGRHLTEELKSACKTIYEVYDQIKDDPLFEGEYGRTNAGEMIAEMGSNAGFREKLKQKNLWTRLVDAIKRIFGIPTSGARRTTAFNELSNALATLLDRFDVRAYTSGLTSSVRDEFRVSKHKTDVAQKLQGKTISTDQRIVVDVFTGNSSRQSLNINRADGKVRVVMTEGDTTNAGTKRCLLRHYDTRRTGYITAEDILSIPDIIENGERIQNNGEITYRQTINGIEFTVLTYNKDGVTTFGDFYSNRKAILVSLRKHAQSAQATTKVGNKSHLPNDFDDFFASYIELTPEQKAKVQVLGTRAAMAMIERGTTSFEDFAKTMIKRFGDNIRPFLKSFYNGVRDFPGFEEYELTPYEDVRKYNVATIGKEEEKTKPSVIETAKQASNEHKVEREAAQAKDKLKSQRNEPPQGENDVEGGQESGKANDRNKRIKKAHTATGGTEQEISQKIAAFEEAEGKLRKEILKPGRGWETSAEYAAQRKAEDELKAALRQMDEYELVRMREKGDTSESLKNVLREVVSEKTRRRTAEYRYQDGVERAQGITPASPNVKPVSPIDFVSKDKKVRATMHGIAHDGGFVVGSDGHALFAHKETYPKKLEGKVTDKKGNEIEGDYPNWRGIRQNVGESAPLGVDASGLRRFVAGVLNKDKKGIVIIRSGDGRVCAYQAADLDQFLRAAMVLGGEVRVKKGDIGWEQLVVDNENGFAAVMPVLLGDAKPDNLYTYEGESRNTRSQRANSAAPLSGQEAALRDAVADVMRESGLEVIADEQEGQRVLDMANATEGNGVRTQEQRQAQDNLNNGINAVRQIANGADFVADAMERGDLAQYGGSTGVSFYWGETGNPVKGYKGGYGLSHIGAKHGTETLLHILDVIANGKIDRYVEGNKTVVLTNGGYECVLALTKNGDKETWLLSGWKKNEKADGGGEVSTQSEPTQGGPTFSRTQLGAAFSDAKIDEFLQKRDKGLDKIRRMRAYHGSGADFEAFETMQHLGEGEGSQVFGTGTYVADQKALGRLYAETSAGNSYKGNPVGSGKANPLRLASEMVKETGSIKKAIERANTLLSYVDKDNTEMRNAWKEAIDILKSSKKSDFGIGTERILYTVEVPEDTGKNYINWDGALSSKETWTLINKLYDEILANDEDGSYDTEGAKKALRQELERLMPHSHYSGSKEIHMVTGGDVYGTISTYLGSGEAASEFLSKLGYTGIKVHAAHNSGDARYQENWNYVVFNDNDVKITDHIRFFRDGQGVAYGFTVGGKIYLDPRVATAETPIHEYTHLWADMIRRVNPSAWTDIKKLMQDQEELTAEVLRQYPELANDEDALADEVLAHYSGRRGAERLREEQERVLKGSGSIPEKAIAVSAIERMKEALKRFWRSVAELLHIRFTTAEQVADRVMADLLHGVNPKTVGRKGKRNVSTGREIAEGDRVAQREYLMSNNYVAQLKGNEFEKNDRPLTERVSEYYAQNYGGEIEREGVGKVLLDQRSVKDSIAHGISRNKAIAFAAVPNIIKDGAVIDRQANWKGRGYGSVTFAAPVEIGGKGYVGIVVANEVTKSDGSHRFYLHQVVLQKSLQEQELKTGINTGSSLGDIAKVVKEILTARNSEEEKTSNDIRRQFIGERGAERLDEQDERAWRLDNLRVAREMEQAGKDASSIKFATGWERGADGKWRYEIADSEVDMSQFDFRNDEEAYVRKRPLDKVLTGKAADELFMAYPELRKVKVITPHGDSMRGVAGYWNKNTIAISAREFNNPEEVRRTLLHEVQHAIQDIEGFASGGSPSRVRREVERIISANSDINNNTASQLNNWAAVRSAQFALERYKQQVARAETDPSVREYAAQSYWDVMNELDNDPNSSLTNDYAGEFGEDFDPTQIALSGYHIDEAEAALKDLEQQYRSSVSEDDRRRLSEQQRLERLLKEDNDEQLYNSLSGEVEARNVERRRLMDEEARRLSVAAETEDVAREDQIFLRGEGQSASMENIEQVNRAFNEQLQQQIDGKQEKGHVYQLGRPGAVLRSAGFPDVPIELSASHLAQKANAAHHPFDIGEMKGLVKALQNPIAVFAYGDKEKAQNAIVEIQHEGKNFVVGVHFNQERRGLTVSDIRGLYPKDNAEWLDWINQGKLLYANKEKIQTLIDQQRRTLADVDYLDLNSVAKVVREFENPLLEEEKNNDDVLYREGEGRVDDTERKLMGVHNISLDKLRKAIRQGGLANPSMAVINTENGIHEKYGEISLIPSSRLIESRSGRNAGTWAGDAYTPRYPQVELRMSPKGEKAYDKDMTALADKDATFKKLWSDINYGFHQSLEGRNDRNTGYALFLASTGRKIPEVKESWPYGDDYLKRLNAIAEKKYGKGTPFDNHVIYTLTPTELDEAMAVYRDYAKSHKYGTGLSEQETRVKKYENAATKATTDADKKKMLDKAEECRKYGDTKALVLKHLEQMGHYAYRINEPRPIDRQGTFDASKKYVEDNGLQQEYDEWRDGLQDKYGMKEYFWTGTDSQGRNRYKENTLANASAWMRNQGRAGAEGNFSGFGGFAAKHMPQMSTREQIRARTGQLHEGAEERQRLEDLYTQLNHYIMDRVDTYDPEAYVDEIADARDPIAFAKREYGISLPREYAEVQKELLDGIKTMPAMYFETKFERPVYLSEFEKAVVPDDTPRNVVQSLQDSGLTVYQYKAGDETSRRDVTMQAATDSDDVLFRTSDEIDAEFPNWLEGTTTDSGKHSTQVNERFNEDLDRYGRGEMAKNEHLAVGRPRGPLAYLMPNEDIILRQKVLTKALKKHGLSIEDVKNLPDALSRPIFIFKRDENTISVLTELLTKGGKNIFVAMELDAHKQLGNEFAEVNDVLTVHGREIENVVLPIIENESLVWVDKSKGLRWLSSAKSNSQAIAKETLDGAAKVVESFENPVTEGGKNLDNQTNTATSMDEAVAKRKVARQLSEKLSTPMRIVEDVEEITHSNPVVQQRRRNSKGWYDTRTGEVVVVLPNNRDAEDVAATIAHETVAHKGLRELVGEERYNDFLDEVHDHLTDELKKEVDDRASRAFLHDVEDNGAKAGSLREHQRRETDELLGRLAEKPFEEMDGRERTLWQRIKESVRRVIDRFLGSLKLPRWFRFGDNELRYMLWRSKERLERGREHPIDLARDIVKRRELGLDDEAVYSSIDKTERSGKNVGERILDTFKKSVSGELKGKPVPIGKLTKEGRKYLEGLSGIKMKEDVDFVLNPSDMVHIYKGHYGENEKDKGNNQPLTDEDIKNMAGVITQPDVIIYGTDAEGKNMFFFLQKHGDGTYNLAEVYGDRHGNLSAKSFYNTKKKGIGQRVNEIKNSLHSTSATGGEFLSSGAKIPKLFETKPLADEKTTKDTALYRDGGRGDDVARDSYNKRTTRKSTHNFREAFQDSMLGLKKLQEALEKETGLPVKDYENVYMQENSMSSRNLERNNRFAKHQMKDLLDAVAALRKAGASEDAIRRYMIAKHGLERNALLAERDAKAAFDKYQKTHPYGKKTLQDFVNEYRKKDYGGLTGLTGETDVAAAEVSARQMVTDFEKDYETGKLWQTVNAATKETLRIAREGGLMSQDTYENVRDMYDYYIPLRGWEECTSDEMYDYLQAAGRGQKNGNSTLLRALGRSSVADDPIATIANMAQTAIIQANRNKLKQSFLSLALNHPTSLLSVNKLWMRYDDVSGEWEPVFPDFTRLGDDATGAEVEHVVKDFNERMEQLAASEPTRYKEKRQDDNIPFRLKPGALNEHQVLVRYEGRVDVVTVNGNPRAAQAINGLTNPSSTQNVILQSAQSLNRFMATNFTARNPDFVLRNLVRDLFFSGNMAFVKEGWEYAARGTVNYGRAITALPLLIRRYEKGTLGTTDIEGMFREFMEGGGETGYTFLRSVDDYKKIVEDYMRQKRRTWYNPRKWLNGLTGALELFSRWAEDTARFTAFMTSKEMGRSTTRAIYDAKEISVNFNKKGAGMATFGKHNRFFPSLAELARDAYIFWNPGVQGLNNVATAAAAHPGRFVLAVGANLMAGLLIPYINKVIGQLIGGDDDDENKGMDEYYKLPEWTRRSNICLWTGSGWLTYPLGPEQRAVYGIGELTTSLINGEEGEANEADITRKYAAQMTATLPIDLLEGNGGALGLVPSYARPFMENAMNEDWTGKPIYKETPWNDLEPGYQKAFSNTNALLVKGSKKLNDATGGNEHRSGLLDINPAEVEHILEGYLGGVASFSNRVIKTGMTIAGKQDYDVRNIPIVNSFYKDSGTEQNQTRLMENKYYQRLDELKAVGNEYQGFRRDAMDPALTEEQRKAALQKMYDVTRDKRFWEWKVMEVSSRTLNKLRRVRDKNPQADSAYKAIIDNSLHMADSLYNNYMSN